MYFSFGAKLFNQHNKVSASANRGMTFYDCTQNIFHPSQFPFFANLTSKTIENIMFQRVNPKL